MKVSGVKEDTDSFALKLQRSTQLKQELPHVRAKQKKSTRKLSLSKTTFAGLKAFFIRPLCLRSQNYRKST